MGYMMGITIAPLAAILTQSVAMLLRLLPLPPPLPANKDTRCKMEYAILLVPELAKQIPVIVAPVRQAILLDRVTQAEMLTATVNLRVDMLIAVII
jgi:hypothetical protein